MGLFSKATREQNKLRLGIDGPAGSGKTYNALQFAFALAGKKGRVAVIDTENNSASKYVGYEVEGTEWKFDKCTLGKDQYGPSTFANVINEASREGYDVIIVDSLTHAWTGSGGALAQVDKIAAKSGNSFTAWRTVTPQHNDMVEALLSSPAHIIVTMRSKMEYVLEKNDKGKHVPRKVGMKPIQREGMEYEFDIYIDFDTDHTMTVSKSRCPAVDGKIMHRPTGKEFMEPIKEWLYSGVKPKPPKIGFVAATKGMEKPKQVTNAEIKEGTIKEIKKLLKILNVPKEEVKKRLEGKKLMEVGYGELESYLAELQGRATAQEGKEAF